MNASAERAGAQGQARQEQPAVPKPPKGAQSRLRWLGPGFLWMVSAAGSGELLFSPRIGSLYGYSLLWALLAAVACKWFINREIGRYAVCTGAPILEGFKQLPGPRNWAVWLIIVPQVVVAISAIAGLASSAATAAVLVLPGPLWLWTLVIIGAAANLVLWGRYGLIEKTATVLGLALAVAAVVTAATVFPSPGAIAGGLVPQVPEGVDLREVLPWLGFALSGAAGMMWYSYWLPPKGYGVAGGEGAEDDDTPIDPKQLDEAGRKRLKGWLTQLTLDNSVAVVGALVILLGFLILGVELLRPQGLVPAEDRIAEVLGQLLGQAWGPFGYWFMIAAVGIAFFSTTLSNQDGWARLLSNGTGIIARGLGLRGRWADEGLLRKVILVVVLAIIPVAVFLLFGNPVALLQLAGAIEAAHLPVLAGLTLYVNYRALPKDLRPSMVTTGFTVLSALFFATFAAIYLYQIVTGSGSGA
jgi:Mn2+/Fe2+ NRAMP family transporter